MHAVVALITALEDVRWTLAATEGAARTLRQYPDLHRQVDVIAAASVPAGDAAGSVILARLRDCERLFDEVQPDLVVRTTPSTGIGYDELIATAVRGRVPVLCVQDFPGTGQILREGEHPLATQAPDSVMAVDETAAAWVSARSSRPAVPVGWIAHERFTSYGPYLAVRRATRARLGLTDQLIVLLIGAGQEIPPASELALLAEAGALDGARPGSSIKLCYRPHPRRQGADRMMLEGAFARLPEASVLRLSEPLPEAELLALPDVVVSGASAMNLEVLSYAGTAASAGQMPLSVYLTDPGQALFPGYWGPGLPSTHRPDGGSILVQAGGLVSGLIAVLEDQPAREALARAALKYAPGRDAARAAIRTAVLAWLS